MIINQSFFLSEQHNYKIDSSNKLSAFTYLFLQNNDVFEVKKVSIILCVLVKYITVKTSVAIAKNELVSIEMFFESKYPSTHTFMSNNNEHTTPYWLVINLGLAVNRKQNSAT